MYDIDKMPIVSEYTYKVFKKYLSDVAWFRSRFFLTRFLCIFRNPIVKSDGLCSYITNFNYGFAIHGIRGLVIEEFENCLRVYGLNVVYPFCKASEFKEHRHSGTQHLCEKRIEFVRAVIEKYEQNK